MSYPPSGSPPQHGKHVVLAYPAEHILLLTINRPKHMNAINESLRADLEAVLDLVENENDIWVVIVTGTEDVFSVGVDLPESLKKHTKGHDWLPDLVNMPGGFASLSRRLSKKPIIAAVNGMALGGGLEIVINCDIVIASEEAVFAFPEPRLGGTATLGGIPRIVKIAGRQKAAELLFTAKTIEAAEAMNKYHFVNEVVPSDKVVPRALEIAKIIAKNSPDAIRNTKQAIVEAELRPGVEASWRSWMESEATAKLYKAKNLWEGLTAFTERRRPKWGTPML